MLHRLEWNIPVGWFNTGHWYMILMFQSAWHHLQQKQIGSKWIAVCFCPSGDQCVHAQLAVEYGKEQFPDHDGVSRQGKMDFPNLSCILTDWPINSKDDNEAILFCRQVADGPGEGWYLNQSSVAFIGQTFAKSHVIVSHQGKDNGMGSSDCTKDCEVLCSHITQAWHELQKLHLMVNLKTSNMLHLQVSNSIQGWLPFPINPPLWASLVSDVTCIYNCQLFNQSLHFWNLIILPPVPARWYNYCILQLGFLKSIHVLFLLSQEHSLLKSSYKCVHHVHGNFAISLTLKLGT